MLSAKVTPGRVRQVDGAFYRADSRGALTRVARVVSECRCQGLGGGCGACREGLSSVWVPVARLREARAW